tara:strand:- start:408 stop:884 length:477 start_codon:yes stop_codon:yes gene_type:complete
MKNPYTLNAITKTGDVLTETFEYQYQATNKAENLIYQHDAKNAEVINEQTQQIITEYNAMSSHDFKNIIKQAIDDSLSTRGKNKGRLKQKCPKTGTDAAAAWQALMSYANPFKIGFGHIMFFNERQSAIYNQIDKALKNVDLRGLDYDRVKLEALGAW